MTHLKRIMTGLAACLTAAFMVAAPVTPVQSAPQIGAPAPDFTVMDTAGNAVSLSSFRGKPVILEWTNHDCPYVRKHYGSGNMQSIQRDLTEDGAVWLTIISSAPGLQGHVTPEEADRLTASRGAYASHVLLDEDGTVGRLYRARTTPHMFLIDADGLVQYMGAIDDRSSPNPDSLKDATNYVRAAWSAYRAGDPIGETVTRPYGCSVKYAD